MLLHSVVPFAKDLLVPAALRLRGLLSSAGSSLKLRGVNKILIKQRVLKGFFFFLSGKCQNVITILVNCALASVCFVIVLYNIISSQKQNKPGPNRAESRARPRRRHFRFLALGRRCTRPDRKSTGGENQPLPAGVPSVKHFSAR